MANDDTSAALGGLRPLTQPYGNVRKNWYRLTTSAVAVFIGQPMDLDGNGQCTPAAVRTNAGAEILGPALAFSKDISGKAGLPDAMALITAAGYLPANTNAYVLIADDPNQTFIIQEVSTTTQLDTTNIGNITGFTYGGASNTSGSTVTGASYAQLDPGYANTDASSGTLVILGLADNMNSDGTYNALGQYAKWRVRIANHRLGGQARSGIQ
jgi:hypothetical protein